MASFPVDILVEIFLRLSTRPLVQFRCVCKSWNYLLTSPSFIKAHLKRSIELRKFNLVKYDLDDNSRVQVCCSPNNEISDLDTSFVENGKKFKLVGSFNGIVCLSTFDHKNPHNSDIFLWNPSTHEKFSLPQPNFHVSNWVGFGFNPLSGHPDDFKVVNMNIYFEKRSNYTSQVEVYSFRKNCWKQLANIYPASPNQRSRRLGDQIILENFICWCPRSCLNRELILFDVVKDVFRTIGLPDVMPPNSKYISLLDGSLSLITHYSSTAHYEVWIMREIGVCESWTKLYTIGLHRASISRCWPLGFANSGEVFFIRATRIGRRFKSLTYLVLYDVRSEKFETSKVKVDSYCSTQMATWVESLISLSSTNDVEQ